MPRIFAKEGFANDAESKDDPEKQIELGRAVGQELRGDEEED